MELEHNPQLLMRSKTEGRITVSGNGIQGFSSPGGEPEGQVRLLQRARTEIGIPGSATSNGQEFNVDRVLYEISRKVLANKKSLLYLFRNNDPSGRGAISREALHRIIRVLHGFLTSDQFSKLLRRLNIHNRSQITYDVFMACFEDAEAMQKRYLRKNLLEPFWKAASAGREEEVELLDSRDERKYIDVATGMERSRSADDRLSNLRRRMLEVMPSIQENFSPDGPKDILLTSKMLRTIIEKAGIPASIEDANVLWDKLDTARCGLVPLRRLYSFVDPMSDSQKPSTAPGCNKPSFLVPTKSQMVPRLAVGAKGEKKETRSLNHYHYPPSEQQQQQQQQQAAEEQPRVDRSLPVRPHFSKSLTAIAGSHKRSLILETDKPVLAQLVNRLVEPREQFMAYCRRFDDDHGNGRIALGQLLGCLLFCGKVVADPLVALLLQKMGIKSSAADEPCAATTDTGDAAGCKKYDYKNLGCAIYDTDANRLLANVIQNPEHYFRLLRSEICVDWCDTEPTNYETLEVKFLKFMYNDIIRLITELRRLDRNNSGVVGEKDFEVAMSRIFNASFTKKQLGELTRGSTDEKGGVLIGEFIKNMFTVAQPEICRIITLSSVKRQQQQKAAAAAANHAPSVEQPINTIPEPASTEATTIAADSKMQQQQQPAGQAAAAATTTTFGVTTEMNEEQAVNLFKQIMKDRFHTFDKQFIALDVKQTKRISQFQLHQILRNMNIHINMRELGYMWKYVPVDADGLCSYRRFLLHFVSNGQSSMFSLIKQKQQQQQQQQKESTNENTAPTTTTVVNNSQEVEQQIVKEEKQLQMGEIDDVLECIRGDVCRQWGILKERIRQEDASGAGHFDTERLSAVIKSSGVDVTDEALAYLSRKYTSIVRNKRRFFYMPFMRYFTRRFSQETNSNDHNKCSCNNNFN